MRTKFLRGALIPTIVILAFVTAPAGPALAAPQGEAAAAGDLWVNAQGGNDANNGLSSASAFRTIQAAARIAGPGTTVHILPGVYRETVIPAADGAASAPMTFLAQNGPGTVKVRGSVASSALAWTRLASNTIGLPAGVNPANIYYANLSSWGLKQPPRFLAQLDAQGNVATRLMPAREPDWQIKTEWKTSEFWWLANGGSVVAGCDPVTNSDHQCDKPSRSFTQLTDTTSDSAPAGVEAGNLKTLGNLTGATLVAMDARHAHYVYRSIITAHAVASGRVTVADSASDDGSAGLGWGSKYYVENHPALLDKPGEWWFDVRSGYLYLWAPNSGSPAQSSLEISRLSTGFDLTGRSYITLNGLAVELFNDQAYQIANANSRYKAFGNVIRNSALRYANTGILLYQYMDDLTPSTYAIDGFTLADSEVGYMDTSAINSSYWWPSAPSPTSFNHSGVRNTLFLNNHLHHLGFNSDERTAVGVRFEFPDKLRFVGNQVDHVAHIGVFVSKSLISSTKQWGFSPSEIKIGDLLFSGNLIEKTCLLGSDCGALKFGGNQRPITHVFRNALVTGNVFRNNTGWSYVSILRDINQVGDANGFYLDYASGVHLYRNITYNNTGAGIKLSCLWRDGDLVLYNNVVANNYQYGLKFTGQSGCDTHNGSVNTQLVNNILVGNEAFAFRFEGAYNTGNFGNMVIDHNLYYANSWNSEAGWGNPADIQLILGTSGTKYLHSLAEIRSATPWEENGVEGDPAFASYNPADHNRYDDSWPDFHLTAGSVNAVDRGTASLPATLSALLTGFGVSDTGAPLGRAFDIGRYESSTPAVSTIQVKIAGVPMGSYTLDPASSIRKNYAGVDSGPVEIVSTDGVTPIVASIRDLWSDSTHPTSSIPVMGLPARLLSTTYYFPAYNNVSLDDQLRFGNVGNAATTVTVKIGGVVMGSYYLLPSQSQRVNYAGLDGGPVVVSSSGGVPIIASLRDSWQTNGEWTSYSQLMGLPASQLSASYYFPAYNNVSLDEQIRFGNVGTKATTVTVKIAGVVMGSYYLLPSQSQRVNYAGLDAGPVVISSSGSVPIIAAIRDAWHDGSEWTSFAQLMGLPASQLSTVYHFPSYENAGQLDGQLRFGNVGTAPTWVTVTIAGVGMGSYWLGPSQSQRISYAGLNTGPVRIESSGGVPIIASLRDSWWDGSTWTSFAQVMGLPNGQLSTHYYFPAYNNISLDEQLQIGAP